MAFDLLEPIQQNELAATLKSHPRFAQDFATPDDLQLPSEIARWQIGRAGYWPDIARKTPFDRPNWHWEHAATLSIGDPKGIPSDSGPLSATENLDSKDLHIAQAISLCRGILADHSRPKADRALAICWLAHLVADAHQPCHAGSLYAEIAFPNGDRGGNSIPTRQRKNLHSLWDSLLGPKFNAGDIRRRQREILNNRQLTDDVKRAVSGSGLDPVTWLEESRELARTFVYTPEVLERVEAVDRGLTSKLESIDLSKEYLARAGGIAQRRAAFAAYRLAATLQQDLSAK